MHTVHSCHDESDLRCICCSSEMCVDLLGLLLIEGDKSVQNVVACGLIVSAT